MPKPKPLGPLTDRTDEQIDALSAGYASAAFDSEKRDWWMESAPAGFEGMIDAEGEEKER